MVLPELEAELSTADLTLNLTPACRTDSLRSYAAKRCGAAAKALIVVFLSIGDF
jgi:hypothetical protein